jgi:hypothetical protein
MPQSITQAAAKFQSSRNKISEKLYNHAAPPPCHFEAHLEVAEQAPTLEEAEAEEAVVLEVEEVRRNYCSHINCAGIAKRVED